MMPEKFVADFLVIFVCLSLNIMGLSLTFFFLSPNQCSAIQGELSANWEILIVSIKI